MTVTTTVPAAPVQETVSLSLADSCDRCGYFHDVNSMGQEYADRISQAFVRVTLPNGSDLLFCGHHYAEYELTFATMPGVKVHDQRDRLKVNPGVSA